MSEAVGRYHFLEDTDPGSCGVRFIVRFPLFENGLRDDFPSGLLGGVGGIQSIFSIFIEVEQRVSENREDPCVYRILDLAPHLLS